MNPGSPIFIYQTLTPNPHSPIPNLSRLWFQPILFLQLFSISPRLKFSRQHHLTLEAKEFFSSSSSSSALPDWCGVEIHPDLDRPLLSLVLQMAAKLDQSSSAEPRLRQPKPPVSPSLAPKVSIFGAKAGFVIPKNKLAGSLVVRGGAKNETPTTSSKEENNKYVQRKTKWGPDLTLYSAVRKARALAYQIRVEQITKELNSGALEIGGNEGSMSAAKASNSDGTDNLKENEQGKLELLELEKQEIIGEILQLNPGYKAPDDYRPLLKETKIPLPTKAHPWHNIIGVLIGPDSNTQKRLQEETGANIQVYGTNKANGEEGEVRQPDIYESQAAYEDLYINVSADSYDKVDAAVALIELLLTPVSVNSADTSATATVSPAVTSGSVNPAGVQQVQSATSQPGLLQYQSHSAHWLSTPQTNCPSIPSSGPMLSPLPNNSLHLQPPVGSFSMPPYTGQPPHMNIMPRSPLPVPGPQPSMPNIEQPLPQFQTNPSIGPPFGRASGFVSPQPVLSSSGPLPVRPLQTPHASGGWPTFSPVTAQSQRPSATFMPVRPPISFSPIGAPPPLQGAVPSVPSQSNFSTSYGTQHSPGANFAPSATFPSRPPAGPQSFPSVSLQGPSSVQVLSSPAGVSPWSPYPLSMQMRPPMSTPAQMRGPPSPFPQVGLTPGMAHSVPSLRPPATLGMPGLSPSASASTSYGQTSIAALRPPHTATGDFTFRPLASPSPAPDLPASASQMGTQANTHLGLPQAPLFRPGNQSPIAPVQGFHAPVDGSLMGQPRVHAPPPCFPGAVPRNPAALQSPTGFRAFPPAVQSGVPTISPPMPPSNPSNSLPPRPFHFLPPQQNPFPNTNRQGGNPGGANPIYDPFAPTTISGAKKADVDPEYEDLMASVGVK